MNVLGSYVPGATVLHRMPAGFKLLGLGAAITVMSLAVDSPIRLAAAAALVAATVLVAGVGVRALATQLRPVLWVVAFVFGFQLLFTDWPRAVQVCGILLLSVTLAAVATATTRTTDMLAAITRALQPLGRIGFPVEQVALALALTIRAIPLMIETVRQVEEARQARGLRFSPRVVVAPVVIAALRTADGFADALVARGLD